MPHPFDLHGDLRDLACYLVVVAPLALTLLAVPTLEEAKRRCLLWPRPVLVGPAELYRRQWEWVLSEASLREGRWWNLVTYMFVHKDEQHLLGNLASVSVAGRAVYTATGVFGLYGVFLGSGAAAGANRRGKLAQVEAQIATSAQAVSNLFSDLLPESVNGFINDCARGASKTVAPLCRSISMELGASGGACGLMGFNLGLAFELLACKLLPQFHCDRLVDTGALSSFLSAIDTCRFLFMEWQLAHGQEGLTGVDHSGHLTGFACGLGLFGFLRAANYACLQWKKHDSDRPRRFVDVDEVRSQRRREAPGTTRRYVNADGTLS